MLRSIWVKMTGSDLDGYKSIAGGPSQRFTDKADPAEEDEKSGPLGKGGIFKGLSIKEPKYSGVSQVEEPSESYVPPPLTTSKVTFEHTYKNLSDQQLETIVKKDTSLKDLDATSCESLTDKELASRLKELPSLKALALPPSASDQCNLVLGSLTKLNILSFFRFDSLSFFCSLKNLKELSIFDIDKKHKANSIPADQYKYFPYLASLRSLAITSPSLSDASIQLFPEGVEALTLFCCPNIKTLDWVSQLPRLKSLKLSGNGIQIKELSKLQGCKNLEILELGLFKFEENHLSVLKDLKKIPKLKKLCFLGRSFTSEMVSSLLEFQALQVLQIKKVQIFLDDVQRLEAHFGEKVEISEPILCAHLVDTRGKV